jgi:hypothetical protein
MDPIWIGWNTGIIFYGMDAKWFGYGGRDLNFTLGASKVWGLAILKRISCVWILY